MCVLCHSMSLSLTPQPSPLYSYTPIGGHGNLGDTWKHATSTSSADTNALSMQNRLHVLFSAPLAWRDRQHKMHPIDSQLNYASERDNIKQVFREVRA